MMAGRLLCGLLTLPNFVTVSFHQRRYERLFSFADMACGLVYSPCMKNIAISFFGGTSEVTGACYLAELNGKRLLVDCGLLQGLRFSEDRNREPFPFDPKTLDAVIITHGHIDHIGRIPKLWRGGFRGKIYSTHPTSELLSVMLMDAFMLMEHESERHHEELLYTKEDLEHVLTLRHPIEYYQKIDMGDGVVFELMNAGHILGSSFVRFSVGGKKIVFTGDVGNIPSVLLPPPDDISGTNILIIESAYGNRNHAHTADRAVMLERAIEDVVARKGVLMIPIFATERTQEILYEINDMLFKKRVPELPVYLDSPLAIKTTEVFEKFPLYYNNEAKVSYRHDADIFRFKKLRFVETKEESMAINDAPPPKIILAGSGMMTGGRILHHAVRYLSDPASILLIVGYQPGGSLGRRLLDHEPQVKILGQMVSARAEVRIIDGFSAHADQEQLKQFIWNTRDTLEKVFVVQGEYAASSHLAQAVVDNFGISAVVPRFGERFEF